MDQDNLRKEEGAGNNTAGDSVNQTTNSSSKIDNEKLWAAVAYILFFIPLLKENRSPFVSFHANQGTLFFIFTAAGSIILSLLPVIGWLLFPVFSVIVLIFFIIGIVNSLSGKMKRLPWFGHIEIVK